MGFYEILDQVVDLLRRRGRVTYRALKREFQVDDAFLEDLKAEIITAQHLAMDEQGEVLAEVHNTGLCYCEAELYRLKGKLLQAAGSGDEAEACFRQALDVARRQQAKSLELRAAMSLSRLWQHQGKPDAAHHLLTEIYGWFTEGFDTADLCEAKALLEELS